MITHRFDKYINLARDISQEIDRPNRHISFIFKGPNLLSMGTNKRKSHPLARKYEYILDDIHSELSSWIRVRHRKYPKSALTLVNFHFSKLGLIKTARPCIRCLPWCIGTFDKIYFSTPEGIVKL